MFGRFIHARCEAVADADLDTSQIWNLEIAITELVSNVIRHGYGGQKSQPIRCEVNRVEDHYEVRIIHRGLQFVPPTDISPLTEPSDGGMGLYIVSQIVDDVQYLKTDDGSQCIQIHQSIRKDQENGKHD